MKSSVMIFLVSLSAFTCIGLNAQMTVDSLSTSIDAKSELSPQLKTFLKSKLIPHSTNPVFVKDVQEQNAKTLSLDAIKKADKEWIEAEGKEVDLSQMDDEEIWKYIYGEYVMNGELGKIYGLGVTQTQTY